MKKFYKTNIVQLVLLTTLLLIMICIVYIDINKSNKPSNTNNSSNKPSSINNSSNKPSNNNNSFNKPSSINNSPDIKSSKKDDHSINQIQNEETTLKDDSKKSNENKTYIFTNHQEQKKATECSTEKNSDEVKSENLSKFFKNNNQLDFFLETFLNSNFDNTVIICTKNFLTIFLEDFVPSKVKPIFFILEKCSPNFFSLILYNFFYQIKKCKVRIQNIENGNFYIGNCICNSILELLISTENNKLEKRIILDKKIDFESFYVKDINLKYKIQFIQQILSQRNEDNLDDYLFFKSSCMLTDWYNQALTTLTENPILKYAQHEILFISSNCEIEFSLLDFMLYIYSNMLSEVVNKKKLIT